MINRGWSYSNANVVSTTSGKMDMYYNTREDHGGGIYLNLWDFYVFNNCYFGVAVIDQQGNVAAFITNVQNVIVDIVKLPHII